MAKAKLVTGLFKNRVSAEAAVDAIMKRGYTRDDISVMMSDATQHKEFALQARTHAADGAGAATGGVIGALIGAGIPEYRAKVYEAGLRSGGILLGVESRSEEEVDKLEELLDALGAEHVRAE